MLLQKKQQPSEKKKTKRMEVVVSQKILSFIKRFIKKRCDFLLFLFQSVTYFREDSVKTRVTKKKKHKQKVEKDFYYLTFIHILFIIC